ncbi:tRNA pseudouridine(55) synthase TruB [Dellaglioa algida]|uniref:tRNA pseudouridine(55) synthase TruB n=1 Tax=Dellaglioa algida TaxID=105612 RepID=UPI000BD50BD6|nr:tRNA pseudouridine(55) synthase TruB [Dellaglioa algida]MDK1718121.1 tRNA pseudouridine(55) synthase TruB [Dellaglioa algida]MDK1727633.1 tRNA pseudouridine(55) synthase TruB [Dellaglioa algida]MDK1729110.1 tRNA pseudouridine(55) synthase TruB [Dellaglioa algida]MDK1735241.1 tRNA pseudouridine(55) synthase TruB [Dellaglioa algida]MDK1736955.1 tRNA pseudouridine(55) synthase TruB [Dellaglioa algida]
MDGIIPLFKERGMTSHDCVFKCRGIFQTKKVGHSGTLDPNVDGVLPICIGKATKTVNYLMNSGKVYRGEITLGFSTETEDLDGETIEEKDILKPFEADEIDAVMKQMTGTMIQIPPMFSAVKVNGRRLYDYARKGETVERPEREITVTSFIQTKPAEYDTENKRQKIYFEVACGKGTYVRTLAVDLGKELGVPAVMSDLTRLESGGFRIDKAFTLDQLNEAKANGTLESLLYPIDAALTSFKKYELTDEQWAIVKNGGFLAIDSFNDEPMVALVYENKIRCLYRLNSEKNRYQSETMFDLG